AEHHGFIRRVFTQRRWGAWTDRRHDRRSGVVLMAILFFHPLGYPGRGRNWGEDAHLKRLASPPAPRPADVPPPHTPPFPPPPPPPPCLCVPGAALPFAGLPRPPQRGQPRSDSLASIGCRW